MEHSLEDPGEKKIVTFDEMVIAIMQYIQVCPKHIADNILKKIPWEKQGKWEIEFINNGSINISKFFAKNDKKRTKNTYKISALEFRQWNKTTEDMQDVRKAVVEILNYKATTEPSRRLHKLGPWS